MKGFAPILAGVATLAFLTWTTPANRSEAEDAYYYAKRVEQASSAREFHVHHALYLPAGRLLFRTAQALGYEGRGLSVLTVWSRVSGAACIGLLLFLMQRYGRMAGPSALALLGSYGFWRYAVEAEIYVPMLALSLAALATIDRSRSRSGLWLASAFLAGALLLHLAAIAALAAAIAVLGFQGRRGSAVRVGLGVSLFVGLILAGLDGRVGLVTFHDSGVTRPFGVASLIQAISAFGHSLVSGNFIFAHPVWAGRLESLFPGRFLIEELFMGRHAPPGTVWISGLTAVLLVAAGVARALQAGQACRRPADSRERRALTLGAGVWLALAIAAAVRTEPSNPEMWLMTLPALWLWLGLAGDPGTGRRGGIPWILAVALLAHNWFGGLRLLQDPGGDYLAWKGEAAVNRAAAGDVVLTADSHVFVTYLAYRTGAEVLDAKFLSEETFGRRLRDWTGPAPRIWVFEEVFHPLPPALRRQPEDVRRLRDLGNALRAEARLSGGNPGREIYEWRAGGWETDARP